MSKHYPHKAWTLGRLLVTTGNQAGGAPLIDRAMSSTEDGRRYMGYGMLLAPWRRNRYGESLPQRMLVIGWKR